MSYQLNSKISGLKPYDPVTENYKIRLDANESFMDLPVELHIDIVENIARVPFNRYPDPLAAKVCRMFADYYSVDPDLVTASNGSDELLSIISSTFLMKGEKILTVLPDFSMYAFYGTIYEDSVVTLDKDDDEIDVGKLIEKANDEKVSMIIFSNPCNPTGRGMSADDVKKLVSSTDALVVLDEAYMDFWDQSLLSCVEDYDNLIILRTLSKAFGMAAIRLGFAVANKKITSALRAVKSPYNVNSLTQSAGCAVLGDHYRIKERIKRIIDSKNALYDGVAKLACKYPEKISLKESYTNFVYIKTADIANVFEKLHERGISVRRLGDYLRVTAGTEYENGEFLRAFDEILMH